MNLKKILKKFIVSILVFISSLWFVLAWNDLIAENWDLLDLTKWNEMIAVLHTRVWINDIIAWANVNLSYSWTEVTINAAWWSWGDWAPYLSNTFAINMPSSSTQNITFNGLNFSPSSTIIIPGFDGSINSVSPISPTELQVNLTSGPAEDSYDIVVSNWGSLNTQWAWNWELLLLVWDIIWAGLAWTYLEDFESNSLWDWTAVTGLTANVSFQTSQNWTPSWGTWPNLASEWAFYVYTETSTPNFPNTTFAIETDNFRYAESISFDYHMFWPGIWTLVVQTFFNEIWTDVFTLDGQQQTNQADAWLNTWNIDLTPHSVEKIRFFYTSGDAFTWDAALDNITIISS